MSSDQKDPAQPKSSRKKTAAKKAAAKKATAKKAASKKKVATKKKVVSKKTAGAKKAAAKQISYAEYRERIALAAYFIAEKRLFENGLPDQDWMEAERQVSAALAAEGITVEQA